MIVKKEQNSNIVKFTREELGISPFIFVQDSTIDIPNHTSLMLFFPYCSLKCPYCYNKSNLLNFTQTFWEYGLNLSFPRNNILNVFNQIFKLHNDKLNYFSKKEEKNIINKIKNFIKYKLFRKQTPEEYFDIYKKYLYSQILDLTLIYDYLLLTGGEPLDNWDNLIIFLDFIKELNTNFEKDFIKIGIQTSAHDLNKLKYLIDKYVDKDKNLTFFHIDLKTNTKQLHKYFSGKTEEEIKNHYTNLKELLKELKKKIGDKNIILKHVVVDPEYEKDITFIKEIVFSYWKELGIPIEFVKIEHYELDSIDNTYTKIKDNSIITEEEKIKKTIGKILSNKIFKKKSKKINVLEAKSSVFKSIPNEKEFYNKRVVNPNDVDTFEPFLIYYRNVMWLLQDFSSRKQTRELTQEEQEKILKIAETNERLYLKSIHKPKHKTKQHVKPPMELSPEEQYNLQKQYEEMYKVKFKDNK